MSKLTAVLDLDWCKYTASSAGEKRSIKVTHKKSGDEYEFKTRTEFCGRKKSKDGGWLEGKEFKFEDFIVEDVQIPEPIENVLHTSKRMVERALDNLGTKRYKAFIGKGQSFRVERSTLLEYKGFRSALIKPVYLEEVTDYLAKKFNAEIVTGIENDDRVVIECYKQPNNIVVGCDKDFYGCPINFFNVDRVEEGIVNGNQFGKLIKTDKNKIRGIGRMHLYFQTCSNDKSDNYAANCFSELNWAEISAYKALVDSKNDKEAWLNIEKVFKKLYPEPKTIIGWRGNEIVINWEYVMNECFDMARMLRFENDDVVASEVLRKYYD